MTVDPGGLPGVHPVLHAIVQSAVEASGARDGWLAAVDEAADELVVVAGVGDAGRSLSGATVSDDEGFCGFVVGTGQPVALAPSADDPRFGEGLAARLGRRPRTVMCVPCEYDDVVVGAVELVDKADGNFSIDDLALVTVLADVAAAVIRSGDGGPALIATPAELVRQLEELASVDPVRYALVAELIGTLMRDA